MIVGLHVFRYSNSDCRWRIQAADANHVVVYFEDFQTESDYDYLHIYDGDSGNSCLHLVICIIFAPLKLDLFLIQANPDLILHLP